MAKNSVRLSEDQTPFLLSIRGEKKGAWAEVRCAIDVACGRGAVKSRMLDRTMTTGTGFCLSCVSILVPTLRNS